MRPLICRLYALLVASLASFVCTPSNAASVLPVPVVLQQAPEWCFAASSAMIFQYLGYPNLNPAGDFQCGVVAAQGGPCLQNCAACLNGGGTMQRIAVIMQSYATMAAQFTGFQNPTVHLNEEGILSPPQIIDQINRQGPIMAGISPGQIPYPPGSGVSMHAVVIVGYDGDSTNFSVIINDPYPYPMPSPYMTAGGTLLRPGQYRVPLPVFINVFHYGNSLTFR